MIQIFPGKTAVYVSCKDGKEHSCKKAKKSLARFSVTFADGRAGTSLQTDQHYQARAPLKWRTVARWRAGSTSVSQRAERSERAKHTERSERRERSEQAERTERILLRSLSQENGQKPNFWHKLH